MLWNQELIAASTRSLLIGWSLALPLLLFLVWPASYLWGWGQCCFLAIPRASPCFLWTRWGISLLCDMEHHPFELLKSKRCAVAKSVTNWRQQLCPKNVLNKEMETTKSHQAVCESRLCAWPWTFCLWCFSMKHHTPLLSLSTLCMSYLWRAMTSL